MNKKPKDLIIDLLKQKDYVSVEKLVSKLFKKYKLSEREVKEALWYLLENKEIAPDQHWNMKLNS